MAPIIGSVCEQRIAKDREDLLMEKRGKIALSSSNRKQDYCSKQFGPLVVAFVGLPARGKTVTGNKLARYLNWTGETAKVFVASEYRRKLVDRYDSHDLFRADNMEAMAIRRKSSVSAMEDVTHWLNSEGNIAILDATNTTRDHRQAVYNYFVSQLGFKLLFVEFVVEDEEILSRNIKEVLMNSPDYKDMAMEKALDDFEQKVQHYMEQYETMSSSQDKLYSFLRILNQGEDITSHKVRGHLETKVQTFLTNFSPTPKTLYFSRHGESENNVLGKIGGDADLSPRGQQYGLSLARHMNAQNIPNLHVWTSELRRTKQTAEGINASIQHLAPLNELDAGVCEGLTYEEMADKYPQEFAWRDQDKLRYRYPWGESYVDIMSRLEPVLLELEHEEHVLVVSHQAILRCVLGYFLNKKPEELPYINVPLHTIIKMTTEGYSCRLEFIKLPVECVDTYRQQPKNCSTSRTSKDALLTVPSHFESLNFWQVNGTHRPLIEQH